MFRIIIPSNRHRRTAFTRELQASNLSLSKDKDGCYKNLLDYRRKGSYEENMADIGVTEKHLSKSVSLIPCNSIKHTRSTV